MQKSEVIKIITCPVCLTELDLKDEAADCGSCGCTYKKIEGVWQLLPGKPADGKRVGLDLESEEYFKSLSTIKRSEPGYVERRFFQKSSARRKDEREQEIIRWFLGKLKPGSLVLDAPCGEGRLGAVIGASGHRPCSMDQHLSRAAASWQRVGTEDAVAIQGDLRLIPLHSDSMGAVMSIRVSYYFDDDTLAKIWGELGRIAPQVLVSYREGNTLVGKWKRLAVWLKQSGKVSKDRDFDQIKRIAKAAGLKVVQKAPGSNAFHHQHFLWLTREDNSQGQ